MINIRIDKGIRHGSFNINGINGSFPTQMITSRNLNHAKNMYFEPFDFKTKIVEIIEHCPKKLVNDEAYRKRRTEQISKIIQKHHHEYFFMLVLGGIKSSSLKFTKNNNEILIDFQKKCGFSFIKIFFKNTNNAKEYDHYRTLIPRGKFIAVLDENMPHNTFTSLYMKCLNNKDEIVGFFGREPSKNKKLINNMLNFIFIKNRPYDKILRVSSFTSKSVNSIVLSLILNIYGFDAFSFRSNRLPSPKKNYPLKALSGLRYVELVSHTKLVCAITMKNLYQSSQEFGIKFGNTTVPPTTHDIVRLNEQFQKLHKKYTRKLLEDMIK